MRGLLANQTDAQAMGTGKAFFVLKPICFLSAKLGTPGLGWRYLFSSSERWVKRWVPLKLETGLLHTGYKMILLATVLLYGSTPRDENKNIIGNSFNKDLLSTCCVPGEQSRTSSYSDETHNLLKIWGPLDYTRLLSCLPFGLPAPESRIGHRDSTFYISPFSSFPFPSWTVLRPVGLISTFAFLLQVSLLDDVIQLLSSSCDVFHS